MKALLERARRGEPLTDLGVIDMHGHLGRWGFVIPDTSPAALVATMDRAGVGSIVVSAMSCMSGDAAGNGMVLAAMREHPGRIEGYVTVWPGSAEQVRADVTAAFEAGFVGLKLHDFNGFGYTDAAYEPALALADERRAPVLLHTWGTDEQFLAARALSARHPDISLLLAHSGCKNVDEYAKIARDRPNVFLDTSFSAAPRGLIAELVGAAGADNVVWGSDAIFLCMPQQLGRVLGADIPDGDKLKLIAANARRILDRVRH